MLKQLKNLLAIVVGLMITSAAIAQVPDYDQFVNDFAAHEGMKSDAVVRLNAVAEKAVVARGSDIPIALVFDIFPNWHIWLPEQVELNIDGIDRFEGAEYTRIKSIVAKPDSIISNEAFIGWPEHHTYQASFGGAPQTFGCFEGRAIAFLPATVRDDAPLGEVTVEITAHIQSCDPNSCKIPADIKATVTFEVVEAGVGSKSAEYGDVFRDFRSADIYDDVHGGAIAPDLVKFDIFGYEWVIDAAGTGLYLLLAIAGLGGFLLNLTPCVLPVIPIKIIGLSQSAQGSRIRTLILGLALGAGVIGFWLMLGFLIARVSSFTASNQLFQYPWFTVTVGVFIGTMAIGMCGLFTIGLPQFVYKFNPGHESIVGSFLFGIMTAILSTPCTAPFMGAAAGWAATKSPMITMLVFAAIGLGMASPYIVLSAYPKLISRMPRTGPASELIKQVMGLLMLAAAVYFIGVGVSGILVEPPNPPTKAYWWAVAVPLVLAGLWLIYRTVKITSSIPTRLGFGLFGLLFVLIAICGAYRFTDKGPIDWTYYTHERFNKALSDGQVVVLEYTAEWCLNCKALEEKVLRSESVASAIAEAAVHPIKVDLTKGYPDGNERLTASGRLTIPLLQIFSSDGKEVFKSDAYTRTQVLNAIAKARGGNR